MKIITRLLAAYALIDLLFRALFLYSYWYTRGPPSGVETASLLSPDHKYKVVQFSDYGGGGLSPFCYYVFSVVPADVLDKLAWRRSSWVTEFDCLGLNAGGIGHGITWSENRRLRIVFDVNRGGTIKLEHQDATGQVFIDYAAQ